LKPYYHAEENCLYETGKRHTNPTKMLMSFAKITYLFDTQKSCITASFLAILLPNSDHIIADQWFEDTKEK